MRLFSNEKNSKKDIQNSQFKVIISFDLWLQDGIRMLSSTEPHHIQFPDCVLDCDLDHYLVCGLDMF